MSENVETKRRFMETNENLPIATDSNDAFNGNGEYKSGNDDKNYQLELKKDDIIYNDEYYNQEKQNDIEHVHRLGIEELPDKVKWEFKVKAFKNTRKIHMSIKRMN